MTRIEPVPAASPAPRRWHVPIPKFSFGRLIKLGVLVLVIWVLAQVARTGMWTIPVLSALFYHQPEPRAVVAESALDTQGLIERMRLAVDGNVRLYDGELTALTRSGADKLHLGVQGFNVVNTKAQPLEMSFVIPKRNNALVRIELQPVVVDGDMQFTVERTRIGLVDVPQWFIGEPTKILLTTQIAPLLAVAPDLQGVQAESGALLLSF